MPKASLHPAPSLIFRSSTELRPLLHVPAGFALLKIQTSFFQDLWTPVNPHGSKSSSQPGRKLQQQCNCSARHNLSAQLLSLMHY